MVNHLLGERSDHMKLIRNFNCFGNKHFVILTKLDGIYHNFFGYLVED